MPSRYPERVRRPLLAIAFLFLAMSAEAKKKERWFSFAAYPGARLLCDEHVSGNSMHISWRSYASKDPVARVVAFYEKDQGIKAQAGDKDDFKIRAPARDDDIVTIYPAARVDDFPTCTTKPAAGEKAIILMSSAAR